MAKILVLLVICAVASAGIRVGPRLGYYDGNDPRTGQSASSIFYGGQIVFSFLPMVDLELSGAYAGSESDITMKDYLVSYIEDEYGQTFPDDESLMDYLENEWGWSPDNLESELLNDYTANFHDIDLAATMKVKIPIGTMPLRPYVGGGAGAHILFSDADVLIQMVSQETGGEISIEPYDHVHPGLHGVVGAAFEPPLLPLSFFGEYRYTKPLGGGTDVDGISMVMAGINLGF